MDELKRYLRLEQTCRLFKKKGNTTLVTTPDNEKLNQLITASQQNNYQLHSYSEDKPQAIIFGFTHTTGKIDQEENLEQILRAVLHPEDIILIEGKGAAEIDYEHYFRNDDFIGRLKEYLSSKNIRVIFNDNDSAIREFLVASSEIKNLRAKIGLNFEERFPRELLENKDFQKAIKDYLTSLDQRDINFCYNEVTGIIPLIRRTAKNYKPLQEGARVIQLVGLLHIYNGVLQKTLTLEKIPYAIFVPKK